MNDKRYASRDRVPNHSLRHIRLGFFITMLIVISLGGRPATASAANTGPDNFQLVVMDSAGKPMANAQVELHVALTTGALDGQSQYEETFSKTTDAAGMASLAIGYGKPTDPKYVFDNFDISQGRNFMRVSIQEAGGWRMLLNSQLPNVPELRKWLFANEKSNTVIAVMIVIWVGIVVYLLLSGRKLRRLEKQLAELQQRRGQSNG